MPQRVRSYATEILPKIEALKERFAVIELGRPVIGGIEYPYFVIRVSGENTELPNIHIQGNIHGNEPAGAYASIEFISKGIELYRKFFNFTIVPSVNPSGFELDTRKNGNNVDLNRNFLSDRPEQETLLVKNFIEKEDKHYLAFLDLHEDKTEEEVEGFDAEDNPNALYMYEKLPPEEVLLENTVGRRTLERLRNEKFPIWDKNTVYKDPCVRGLIHENTTGDLVTQSEYGTTDEFLNHRIRYALTCETPTWWVLQERVRAHVRFLHIALEELA